MSAARLKFNGQEAELTKPVTTIGRTPDNDVAFSGDSNVSRGHAEIELRDGAYYLIDPGSSNGTTVNGSKVTGEIKLKSGDKIVFGGSSEAEFVTDAAGNDTSSDTISDGGDLGEIPGMSDAGRELGSQAGSLGRDVQYSAENAAREAMRDGVADALSGSAGAEQAATSGSNPVVLIAGAVCGLAVVAAVAAGAIFYAKGRSECTAAAKIVRPETGDTLSKPTDIEIDVTDGGCVQKAVLVIDGKDVAAADPPSFSSTIDPKDVPDLSDGDLHDMSVVLIDDQGQRMPASPGVMLAFDTRTAKKEPTPVVVSQATPTGPKADTSAVTLIQVQQMSQELVKKFSGNFSFDVSNKQFVQEVQKRTGEYAVAGYTARALAYRDKINVAFGREQNIDAPLGFILAMSRSKFDPTKHGDLEGIFQMSSKFAADNAYNGTCGTATLSDQDQDQDCAAKAAALYMKALVFGVFDGDPIYSAVAFGKTPAEAAAWKATLPANRSDVWKSITTAPEREQLIRFFAAGIVSENPQRFGLKDDHPLSELYRVAM